MVFAFWALSPPYSHRSRREAWRRLRRARRQGGLRPLGLAEEGLLRRRRWRVRLGVGRIRLHHKAELHQHMDSEAVTAGPEEAASPRRLPHGSGVRDGGGGNHNLRLGFGDCSDRRLGRDGRAPGRKGRGERVGREDSAHETPRVGNLKGKGPYRGEGDTCRILV
jgi:hypothetical protein